MPDEMNEPDANAPLDRHLAELEADYLETGNPLFAWIAMAACHSERAVVAAGPRTPPEWVMRCIGLAASTMRNLALGRDWRAFDQIPDEGWSRREREAVRAWAAGTLDADDAARLVPWALGLTRPGFNAFRQVAARDAQKALAERVARLRAEGMTAEQAAEQIAETEGYSDTRSVKRIVSKARRRVAKPTG
jgi:hypothetical protein